jgi:ANTAR domain/PAS fold
MTLRQDLTMLGHVDAGSQADERLVAGFSTRLDHRVGRFLGRPQDDRWVWDQQLVAILGYSRSEVSPSLRALLQHVPEEERELAVGAFQAALEHGHPALVSCRLYAADGTFRSVLITADVMEAEPSELSMADLLDMDGLAAAAGPWMAGLLIDLTDLRLSAARAAADHAVAEAGKHRAVIEQAKGILMLIYRIDADTAFEMLRRHSQNTNTKLRDLAARLVDQATELRLDTAPAEVDALLRRSS